MTTPRSDEAGRRFGEVFRHLDRVAAYAGRRGASDSDDIAAETMAIAWCRLADVPADDPLPWLLGVARDLSHSQRRAGARTGVGLDGLPEVVDRPRDELGLDPALAQALRALPELEREALLLIAWEGLSLNPSDLAARDARIALATTVLDPEGIFADNPAQAGGVGPGQLRHASPEPPAR